MTSLKACVREFEPQCQLPDMKKNVAQEDARLEKIKKREFAGDNGRYLHYTLEMAPIMVHVLSGTLLSLPEDLDSIYLADIFEAYLNQLACFLNCPRRSHMELFASFLLEEHDNGRFKDVMEGIRVKHGVGRPMSRERFTQTRHTTQKR